MPFYQCIINAEELHIECDGDETPLFGFYTGRKIFAANKRTAHDKMLTGLQRESRVRQMVCQSRDAGRAPTFRVSEIWEIGLWTYLFGSRPKGFIFYPEHPESDSECGKYRILRFT